MESSEIVIRLVLATIILLVYIHGKYKDRKTAGKEKMFWRSVATKLGIDVNAEIAKARQDKIKEE